MAEFPTEQIETLLRKIRGERLLLDDDVLPRLGIVEEFDCVQEGTLSLLTPNRIQHAFDVEKVDPKVRDDYGRTLFGSGALIARQPVEEGIRFVNVT